MSSLIIASSRPTVETKHPPGQEMLSNKVALALAIDASQMDGTLAFDLSHDLRNRILRWDLNHHVDVVDHEMAFLDPTLLL